MAKAAEEDDEAEEEEQDPLLDAMEQAKDEKLKVVVRVRPLQPKEVAWWNHPNTQPPRDQQHANDPLGQELMNPKTQCMMETSKTPSYAASCQLKATDATQMCLHENSVMWEKNGQMKILVTDAVFDHQVAQDQVFHSVEDCVEGLLAGYDCSVFAYGQTGTGKTFTMSGLDVEKDVEDKTGVSEILHSNEAGVVPRAINKLFEEIAKATIEEQGVAFSVYCSFIEIYNEKIYDVLSVDPLTQALKSQSASGSSAKGTADPVKPPPHEVTGNLKSIYLQRRRAGWNRTKPVKEAPNLCIRQKLDGSVFVDGLTLRNITTKEDMMQAFIEGSRNREVRDNLYNEHSSRGHSIFQVTLRKSQHKQNPTVESGSSGGSPATAAMINSSSTIRLSRLFFVDLAGSEKWHIHGNDLGDKYAAELSSINKSLSALTNCVVALGQKDRTHVPFRDSILTRLLQTCLQGIGKTTFIVTLSPAQDSLEESFATLRFAERLKALRSTPIRKKAYTSELQGEQRLFYEKQIQTMRLEVTRLRELLKKAQKKNSEIAEYTANVANTALLEENRRLKELLMHTQQQTLSIEKRASASADALSLEDTTASPHDPFSYPSPVSMMKDTKNRRSTEDKVDRKSNLSALASDPAASKTTTTTTRMVAMVPKAEEFDTLVTKLHSKEAKLNWMLEAEMEAQNTKAVAFHGLEQPSVLMQTKASADDLSASASPKHSHHSPTSRMWLVEKRLLRQNTLVPSPLRTSHHTSVPPTQEGEPAPVIRDNGPPSDPHQPAPARQASPRQEQNLNTPTPKTLPALAPSTERKAKRIEALMAAGVSSLEPIYGSIHHRAMKRPNGRKDDASRPPQPAKLEPLAPRKPARSQASLFGASTRSQARQVASIHPRSVYQEPARSREPTRPAATATRYASPPGNPRNRYRQEEPKESQPINSTSILKLMGSNEASSAGITKEELVEEYKRARRAELEVMLRSMVDR